VTSSEEQLSGGELAVGDRIGAYVVTGLVGRGGCAIVYSAEHLVLGRRVAVKVLRAELAARREMIERFVQEARAINLIGHPNIVDVHDIGSLPARGPYLVMEFLEGENLAQLLERCGRLAPRELIPILDAVADAVGAAHALGVIHRDLKPSNLFLARGYGGQTVVKLLDFGIAKLLDRESEPFWRTATGERLGTPAYMAPEQLRGEAVGRATDVYALAATAYHALTGRAPFGGDWLNAERLHLEAAPPPPSQLAPLGGGIDAVLLRAMAKQAVDRHPSVRAFVDELAATVDRGQVDLRPAATPALAVFGSALGDGDDEQLAAVDFADALEDSLRAAGFAIAMRAGASCLAVIACPADRASALVTAAVDGARAAIAAAPGCRASVFVRRGTADLGGTDPGGPLLEYASWLPTGSPAGVFVADATGAFAPA
jgi:serine/threonine-protein kinase